MSTQLSISTFVITDAIGGSGKDSISERELNIVRREKIMTQILGNPKDLITLSLSLSLRYLPIIAFTFLGVAGIRDKGRLRLARNGKYDFLRA